MQVMKDVHILCSFAISLLANSLTLIASTSLFLLAKQVFSGKDKYRALGSYHVGLGNYTYTSELRLFYNRIVDFSKSYCPKGQ